MLHSSESSAIAGEARWKMQISGLKNRMDAGSRFPKTSKTGLNCRTRGRRERRTDGWGDRQARRR